MRSTLLPTKLRRPATPSKQVPRPQLIRRLNEGLEAGRLLTLISAPAGFGKTTCAGAWLEQLDRPSAWLSLDPADDDPGRFFLHFIAALQRVDPRLGNAVESALETDQLPPVDALAAALIQDLSGLEQPLVLALDDFQAVQDQHILQALEQILAGGIPQLHLVLVTREDPLLPLARLRANNLLTEIRSADLRFSSGETGRFFAEIMALPLDEADIQALEERTEGWIAGLQLAGLSLRGREDPTAFIAGLSGSHRHILSYLTEEVLSRQDKEVQDFLLQTSILEKLSGELCDAVTGRSGSAEMLEQLLHANLFLIPLDDEGQWYRYHHLFAGLLRTLLHRSAKEQVKTLHRRASRWFAEAGMAADAIEHALAAEDYPQAVAQMEQHAMEVVMLGHVKTAERWFQSIPAEQRLQSPRASLALAGLYLLRGSYGLVDQYLKQAEPALISPADGAAAPDSLRAEWCAIQSNLLNVQGKAAESIEMARQALQAARPEDHYLRGIANLGLGGAYRMQDDYPGLVEAYQQAIYHSRIAGKALPEMLSTTALALMAVRHGELHFAEQVAAETIRRLEASGQRPPPVAGSIYGALGMVYYEWDRLDRVGELFREALQLSRLGGHNAGVVFAHVLLSRLGLAQGDLEMAVEEIRLAAGLLPLGVPAWLKPEFVAQQVRVELRRGKLPAARSLLESLGGDIRGTAGPGSDLVVLARLRLRLAGAGEGASPEELSEGIDLAGRLVESARRGNRVSILLPALLLRAQLHDALGDRPAALEDMALALDIARPEGYLRTFLDEGLGIAPLVRGCLPETKDDGLAHQLLKLLAPGGAPDAVASSVEERPLPVESLTERELDVLRLIARGLKYEQAAAELFISVNTVRFYVKAIYAKLHVNNRTQAVSAARQLGLL